MLHDGPATAAMAQVQFRRGRYVIVMHAFSESWCVRTCELVRRTTTQPDWRVKESFLYKTQLEAAMQYTLLCEQLMGRVCR